MTSRKTIHRQHFAKLPEEAASLVASGQYSLYEVVYEKNDRVDFALRTGYDQFYMLQSDGEPLCVLRTPDFVVRYQIDLEGIDVKAAVLNFKVPEVV
ncbi:MAG: hypothetical protein AAF704_12900 [Cyanobacteria bacterium P01_D01_bin.123]